MSKITNIVFVISGLMLLIAFAGFNTATGSLLSLLGVTTTSSGGEITGLGINTITAALIVVAVSLLLTTSSVASGSITIGTFGTSTTPEKLVAIPANTLLLWGILDLLSLFNIAKNNFGGLYNSWIMFFTALIIFPLILAYIIAIIEFWRGSD